MGFSKQEYWSGVPSPSPRYIHTYTHTSISSLVTKLCLTLVTPLTVSHQTPLSMRFPRQKYWSGLPFHSPEDLPNPGIESGFPALQAVSLPTELPGKPHLLTTCLDLGGQIVGFMVTSVCVNLRADSLG